MLAWSVNPTRGSDASKKKMTKMTIFRCTYYFPQFNMHGRYFSTHPPTLICTLCKLEKPYTKMDHPLSSLNNPWTSINTYSLCRFVGGSLAYSYLAPYLRIQPTITQQTFTVDNYWIIGVYLWFKWAELTFCELETSAYVMFINRSPLMSYMRPSCATISF